MTRIAVRKGRSDRRSLYPCMSEDRNEEQDEMRKTDVGQENEEQDDETIYRRQAKFPTD